MSRFLRLGSLFPIIAVLLLLSVGCGGGGGGSSAAPVVTTTSATTGQPITVDLSRSTLSVNKTTAVANGSDQIVATLTARDSSGSPVAGFAFAVQVSGSGNTLTQPAPTDSNGVTQAVLVSTRAEGKSVTASLNGTPLGSAATVTFLPGPPAKLTLRVPPPSQIEQGAQMSAVRVAVEDQFGNLVTDPGTGPTSISVTAIPENSGLSGTLSQSVVNGFAEFSGLSFREIGNGRVLRFELGEITGTSSGINVVKTPSATNELVLVSSPTGSRTAAEANLSDIVVRLRNENGIDLRQSGVPVSLVVSTGPGALEGTTVVDTDAEGVATFSGLSLKTAGTYRVTATSSSQDFPNSVTSDEFSVTADSSNPVLRFTAQPDNSIAVGSDFAVQVEAVDQFGNYLDSFGSSVNLSLQNTSSVPAGITLTPTAGLDQTATLGVAEFSGLAISGNFETTETGYFLRASSAGGLSVDSSQFSLEAGDPDSLQILNKSLAPTVQPAEPFEGSPFSLSVAVVDEYGNRSSQATDTIAVSLDDSQATPIKVRGMTKLSGTFSQDAEMGVATFDDLKLNKTGAGFILTASAPGLASDSTNPFTVALSSGPRTLVVDNVIGKSPAEGGNGLPDCPFATIDQALAEAESDFDVNTIEVVATGVDYTGDVNLAAPGLFQSITLRGRSGGRPTLTGQVTLNGEDLLQSLKVVRNASDEALIGSLDGGGGAVEVDISNDAGPGISLSVNSGRGTLSGLHVTTLGQGAKLTAMTGAAWTMQQTVINTSAGTGLEVTGGAFLSALNDIYAIGGPAFIATNIGATGTGDDFGTLSSVDSPTTGVSLTNVSGANLSCNQILVSQCGTSGVAVTNCSLIMEVLDTTVVSTVMAPGSRGVDLLTHSGSFSTARLNVTVNGSGLVVGDCRLTLRLPGGSAISTEAGPALICQGTTFGPGDVEFRLISSRGGNNGIYLANTTGTPFAVAGSGFPGSGGTLQSISGNAVELINSSNVTLKNMTIGQEGSTENIVGNGIDATDSGEVSIENCRFFNVKAVRREGAIWVLNPTGSWRIDDTEFRDTEDNHLAISNRQSPNIDVSVERCVFDNNDRRAGISYQGGASSSGSLIVKGSTFRDIAGISVGIEVQALGALDLVVGGPDPGNENDFQKTGSEVVGTGIDLSINGTLTFDVQNNKFNGLQNALTLLGDGTFEDAGLATGKISGNTVGNEVLSTASGTARGFYFEPSAEFYLDVDILDNVVRTFGEACWFRTEEDSRVESTIARNLFAGDPGQSGDPGLSLLIGERTSVGTPIACLDIFDNIFEMSTRSGIYFVVGSTSQLQLPGYSGPATGSAAETAVKNYFVGRNTYQGTGIIGTVNGTVEDCPQP